MQLTRRRLIASGLSALFVAATGFALFTSSRPIPFVASPRQELSTFDVAEAPPPAMAMPSRISDVQHEPPAPAAGESAIAVTVPRIAYTYGYSFRLDAARVAAVQERHLALCRRLGPTRCRVIA